MAQQSEGGRKDRLLMVGNNKVVALVLPHQIRNGLHLYIHIAGKHKYIKDDDNTSNILICCNTTQSASCDEAKECTHFSIQKAETGSTLCTYLKKAMRRLTISIYCTKR